MPMKNRTIDKTHKNAIDHWIRLSSAGFLLMIVLLYLLRPELGVSINRLMEMTLSGSAKGLMMIYYQYGDFAWAMAGLNHMVQMMSLVMDKEPVKEAIYGLFSPMSGRILFTLSGLTAVWVLYGIGSLLRGCLLLSGFLKNLWLKSTVVIKKYEFVGGLLALGSGFIGQGVVALVFIALGFLGVDYRKILAFSLIGLSTFGN